MLAWLGFHVLIASSVLEALNWWDAQAVDVHLVLTDYHSTGKLTGMDLVRILHAHRPTLPVLIVSSYWHPRELGEETLPSHVHFLAKPFGPTQLSRAIRSLLSAHSGPGELRCVSGRLRCH